MLVMPEQAIERLDQAHDHAHRDRIQADERLVVDQHLRIHDDGARQRHPPRHAAREFGRHQVRGAAQSDRLQFHQHQLAQHRLGQLGVLAQRECHVLEHRQIGQQRAVLEQQPDALAQLVELAGA